MVEYNALVFKHETGPIARYMEIFFPAILAKHLTEALAKGLAFLIVALRLSNLSSGTWKFPCRSMIKPNHLPICYGFRQDLGMFSTTQFYSRSDITTSL